MNRKVYFLLLLCGLLFSCTPKESNIIIGIAWRGDSSDVVKRACESAGLNVVMLPQVIDSLLPYDTSNLLTCETLDENKVLKEQYADIVKNKTYEKSNVLDILKGIDAVIFTGGEDIAPSLYADVQKWHGIYEELDYNATRDVSDYLLMSYCIDNDIPILGICRGAQMLGVVSGAAMLQDIPTWFKQYDIEYDHVHRNHKSLPDYANHYVEVTKGSLLEYLADTTYIDNAPSFHHQCIGNVDGTMLKIVGTTNTHGYDLIEAVQREDCTFAVGLQFHPEIAIVKHLDQEENEEEYMDYRLAQDIFYRFSMKCKKRQ